VSTRFFVDAWDPGYGSAFEPADGGAPAAQSTAQLDVDVELEADAWRPLAPPADQRAPDVVLLVDGVRRNDARVWTEEDDGASYAGLAASYAAGTVRCDLRRGAAELVASRIGRGLFTASPGATDVVAGPVRYAVHRVGAGEPEKLQAAVQGPLTELEVGVAVDARGDADARASVDAHGDADAGAVVDARGDADDLLVVDGPLRGRRHLPRTIGYVKTHHRQYLPAALSTVVTSLRPGQRSPVFRLGTAWGGYSWYLRLPGPAGAPWAGVVRGECSTELPAREAIRLADLSAVTLPRFASTAYKDPRAPQNLIPIAGLERRLRGLLGDPRLLHRVLTLAAAAGRTVSL
jgi:hypothetical protein